MSVSFPFVMHLKFGDFENTKKSENALLYVIYLLFSSFDM